jgi:hypothetical protein
MDSNSGPATELVPAAIAIHNEHLGEATVTIMDPLFNIARKAPHPDVVIVKQEAGWFQLWEEKRQKKIA